MAAILLANAVSAQNYEKNILGVRLGAGVVWKRIYFGLGYDIGCLNLVKESDGEGTMRNNCFTISVGYNF